MKIVREIMRGRKMILDKNYGNILRKNIYYEKLRVESSLIELSDKCPFYC